jgi:hypothetical protein
MATKGKIESTKQSLSSNISKKLVKDKRKKRGFVGILKGKIHYKSDAIFNLSL